MIKAARPETKIVLTEPALAGLVASGEVQGPGESHPAFSPHPIQGGPIWPYVVALRKS